MASRMVLLIVVAATVFQCATAQTSHVVGDSLGWIIPASPSVYSDWASKQTFKVGDSLVFNFAVGLHTAYEVSKADYDSCNAAAAPIGSLLASSPATIRLATAGNHYYLCTLGGHCSAGQKLSITVASGSAAAAPTPVAGDTPAASPTPVASPVPSPSTSPVSAPAMSPDMSPSLSIAVTPTTSPAPASTSTGGPGVLADSPAGSAPAAAPPSNSAISVAVSGFSLVALLSAFFM
ncbi:hypothetical protein C5167_012675 [Papaver somniferum]|uniref:Phytocyanin domain-containing protein n=1 Tax=Papaver somniferum TaxID=3469 RepID=A0A4Y7J239_PAPSO|nr:cucumber peeling cupredoxin-like [Papaver somniferum]RZC53818.1 hypothetical protein C5167_012675 [Papaver somniferum]